MSLNGTNLWDTLVDIIAAPAKLAESLVGNSTISDSPIAVVETIEPSYFDTALETAVDYANWIGTGAVALGLSAGGLFWRKNSHAVAAATQAAVDAAVAKLVPAEHREGLSDAAKAIIAALDGQEVDFAALAQNVAFRALGQAQLGQFMGLDAEGRLGYVQALLAPVVPVALNEDVRAALTNGAGAQAAYIQFIDNLQQSSIKLLNQIPVEHANSLRGIFLASAQQGGRAYQQLDTEARVNQFIRGFANNPSRNIRLIDEGAPAASPSNSNALR